MSADIVQNSSQPNVLIVLADQWRAQSTGFGGCEDVHTPHLDAFAKESCHLPYAMSGTPVCTPARASLLTALRPDRHGLFLNDAPLNAQLPSIAKHYKEHGYNTAYVGKWHINGYGRSKYIPPDRRQGFDYFKVLECTHNYWKSSYYENNDDKIRVWDDYDAYAQCRDLQNYIRDQRDEPFFSILGWGPPHNPYETAPKKWKEFYKDKNLSLAPNIPEHECERAHERLAGYYAHCSALDESFGELLDTLKAEGKYDNTIIIFTSDHGDFIGAHDLYDKQGPWDESIRIPFLIRAPGLIPYGENNAIIELIDLWPTLAGLHGWDINANIQGRDWSQELQGNREISDNYGLFASYHSFGNWPAFSRNCEPLYQARNSRGIISENYVYCIDHNGPWLLYDRKNDPYQTNNLIDNADFSPIQHRYSELLKQRLIKEKDEFLHGEELVAKWGWQVNEHGTIAVR